MSYPWSPLNECAAPPRADIAHRTKVLRRAATRPRRSVLVWTTLEDRVFGGRGAVAAVAPAARSMTWKAARARILEIHAPDRKTARRALTKIARGGGKLRPAPGAWWQSRFADLIERRAAGTPRPTRVTLDENDRVVRQPSYPTLEIERPA